MTRRSILDGVLVVLTLVALGFGSVLAIRPAVLPPAVLEAVVSVETAVDPDHALIAIAAVVGLFALWRSYFSGASDVRDAGPQTNESLEMAAAITGSPTEQSEPMVVGAGATERVERTIDALERGQRATMERDAVTDDVRESLRAVEHASGRSSDAVEERIQTGAWTDDQIAAVFLGDTSAGTLSLGQRLRMWLFPGRTFEKRLERTLSALEQHATDGAFERKATGVESAARDGGRDQQDEPRESTEDNNA
ncbi:DUF7269 family protein [Natronolimnobius baerhuensis]|uniref:Uncharacterized protein n=1 Tax=Natronolimnobius baerhuensis TaxID=253108 RepID=A0A202E605_9EURY|nr:hypothetical protein [Natronolimnobius baerhuensis]OVE83713.1 hypothetical protein B2G88_14900 [Natronolimnobius baerhuensis]